MEDKAGQTWLELGGTGFGEGGSRVIDVPGAFRNKLAGLSSHPQDSPSSAAAWITAEAGP